jgi:hypothetical protein
MNDKDLADRIVALGILDLLGWSRVGLLDYEIVSDWRVVGALMERCGGIYAHNEPHINGWWAYVETDKAVRMPVTNGKVENDSLPRAICEACVAALEDKL